MNKTAVNTIGFWSALLAFIFSNAFTVGAAAGSPTAPGRIGIICLIRSCATL
jgi:hypothetical protein